MGDYVTVRSLAADDLDWVVRLAASRAEQRRILAPRFWRPAPDARRIHARYLNSLLEQPGVAALRTDHMFAFAISQPRLVLVDDAAAENENHWATEGPVLFRRLAGASRVRFVCPVPEPERSALAVTLGLKRAETWWHRDLPHFFVGLQGEGPVRVSGARGNLVVAPPVYAPGGTVLLVQEFRDRVALARIESVAARRGASVSVVAASLADDGQEDTLLANGYRRTCDFYEGPLEADRSNR